jgi:hypothetical protein
MAWHSRDGVKASREEERALLAICAYPASEEGDRLAQARYLLQIEARGELGRSDQLYRFLKADIVGIRAGGCAISRHSPRRQ